MFSNKTYVDTFRLTEFSTACGGPSQGQCRPINDGFNSACYCNPGWYGPKCELKDPAFFDVGFDGRTIGRSCGKYGREQAKDAPVRTPGDSRFIDSRYFDAVIAKMAPANLGDPRPYAGYKCVCEADTPFGYDTNNLKGVCARNCTHPMLKGCSGHGKCIYDPVFGSMDRVCQCDRGWTGEDCNTVLSPGDNATLPCGGPTRGVAVYTDTYKLKQACVCRAGYNRGTNHPTCYKPCPLGKNPENGTLQACSYQSYGYCRLHNVTHPGDEICACDAGSRGLACEEPTACGSVFGLVRYTCNGQGKVVDGLCVCNPGYVGACCQLNVNNLAGGFNHDCGLGQPYRVDASVKGAARPGPPLPPPPPQPFFDPAAYLIRYPEAADNLLTAVAHFQQFGTLATILDLKDGRAGRFDPVGYMALHKDLRDANVDPFRHLVNHGLDESERGERALALLA